MCQIFLILIILVSLFFLIKLEIKRERSLCKIREIYLYTDKIDKNFDFLYLSDFHNTDNRDCFKKVEEAINDKNIDYVVSGGDMVTYSPKRKTGLLYDNFFRLLDIIESYKKNFLFGYGNHENRFRLIRDRFKDDIDDFDRYENDSKKHEFIVLDDAYIDVTDTIRIYEIQLLIEFYKKTINFYDIKKRLTFDIIKSHIGVLDETKYNIILCHNPDYSENLIEYGFDLVLAGHQHGGLIRVPLLGPIFSPEMTFMPPYNKGLYKYRKKDILVSSGMGEHTLKIRINNIPEIYKVHIMRKEK